MWFALVGIIISLEVVMKKIGGHMRRTLEYIYRQLLEAYGPQGWWPGDGPIEVMVGAVLTQATNWRNVEKAISRLKEEGLLSFRELACVDQERLAQVIRPAGYYNVKAQRLKALARFLVEMWGGDVAALSSQPPEQVRQALLGVYGLGPETVDSILLYALGHPYFVVDAYTKRIFRCLGLGPPTEEYETWQRYFMDRLPPNTQMFNEYHALLVRHGKERCRKRPYCPGCPLIAICSTGQVCSR